VLVTELLGSWPRFRLRRLRIVAAVAGENMAKLCDLMLILCGMMSTLHDS
jgi:hypothetical protein